MLPHKHGHQLLFAVVLGILRSYLFTYLAAHESPQYSVSCHMLKYSQPHERNNEYASLMPFDSAATTRPPSTKVTSNAISIDELGASPSH